MVDVHDQIFDLEIAQVRQERLGNRAVPVALALYLGPLLLEDVRLGDDLQLGPREPEPLRELTDGDVDGDVQQLVRSVDQHTAQAVFGKQLCRALGAPLCARDEQHGVPALAHAPDFGDPLLNAAAEFDRRLTGDVQGGSRWRHGSGWRHGSRWRRWSGWGRRSGWRRVVVGLDFSRAFANRQLIQPRGCRKPLADFGPRDQQLFGRRRARVVSSRLFEARLRLLDQLWRPAPLRPLLQQR